MIVVIWRSPFFVLENETEVSFFSRELYEAFKANPEVGLANVCFFFPFSLTRYRLDGIDWHVQGFV
jgi:hypothetical protein